MQLTEQAHAAALIELGWSSFFGDQVGEDEAGLVPVRIAYIHRTRMSGHSPDGSVDLALPAPSNTSDYAVGDFVLAEPGGLLVRRRLARRSLLTRRLADGSTQLSAANIDTLFVVTSCNNEFNVARLERYLAMASQAQITPVLVLTKADTADDAAAFVAQAAELARDLSVIVVDPRRPDALSRPQSWFSLGKTAALTGSSGVGKSTLVNTLVASALVKGNAPAQFERMIPRGHTTTARSLHAVAGGGWVLDSPGIRTLHLSEMEEGLDSVFAEITDLATHCKFSDCTHSHEPSCAVLAAVGRGEVDTARHARWRRLHDENSAGKMPRPRRR